MVMLIKVPDTALCGNILGVQSCPGGLELPAKVCRLPHGHPGYHTDGVATWLNVHEHIAKLQRGER